MNKLTDARDNIVLKSIFAKFDRNGDNYLSFIEFSKLCSRLGFHLKGYQFLYLDINDDNKISFNEFQKWWIKDSKFDLFLIDKTKLLYQAYELYKKAGSTFVLFQNYMKNSMEISIDNNTFDALDLDGDDKLSFYEFCKWLQWF